jgi:hypothetical protein
MQLVALLVALWGFGLFVVLFLCSLAKRADEASVERDLLDIRRRAALRSATAAPRSGPRPTIVPQPLSLPPLPPVAPRPPPRAQQTN